MGLKRDTSSYYSYRIAGDADDARLQQCWPLRLETKDDLETRLNANENCIRLAASQFVSSFRVKWFVLSRTILFLPKVSPSIAMAIARLARSISPSSRGLMRDTVKFVVKDRKISGIYFYYIYSVEIIFSLNLYRDRKITDWIFLFLN